MSICRGPVHSQPRLRSSQYWHRLNAFARFWEGEPAGEPRSYPARTEAVPESRKTIEVGGDTGSSGAALFDPLQLDHVAINPAVCHEFVVAAGFDDRTIVENENPIGMADRTETVSDHE
jgi:hypothetical protein